MVWLTSVEVLAVVDFVTIMSAFLLIFHNKSFIITIKNLYALLAIKWTKIQAYATFDISPRSGFTVSGGNTFFRHHP